MPTPPPPHEPRTPRPARTVELEHEHILAALSGSRPALARLWRHYQPLVRAAVARRAAAFGRQHELDELCQEVWVRLLANDRRLLRYFDPERGAFGPFVQLLADQQAQQALRAELRHAWGRTSVESIDRAQWHDYEERGSTLVRSLWTRRLVRHAQHALDARDYALLVRHTAGGLEITELARELGTSCNALYKRHDRLRTKLDRLVATLPGCGVCRTLDEPSPSASRPSAPPEPTASTDRGQR